MAAFNARKLGALARRCNTSSLLSPGLAGRPATAMASPWPPAAENTPGFADDGAAEPPAGSSAAVAVT
eukprot:545400-Lingulodinium_polyedra.AAC.1